MERKTASSDVITRAYIDSLLVEVRHLDAVTPTTATAFFGHDFATPISTAALSHLGNTAPDGMAKMAEGANAAGALTFSGMGPRKELEAMVATGAKVVKIVKPYEDRELVYAKLKHAADIGCIAVGIDIDHAFDRQKGYDEIEGRAMYPLSSAELADMVAAVNVPFVIKGVLSAREAVKCVTCGVQGMVVSHHNGRLECAVPPLMVLPEIRAAVGDRATLFVDCSIQSGMDAFKALALGADGVCVGRPLMPALKEKGAQGVADVIRHMTSDLRYTLAMTANADVHHIDPSIVRLAKHVW